MNPLRTALAGAALGALLIGQPAVAADPQPSGAQMVDALHSAFGDHHVRAVHAKGVLAVGTFEPSPDATAITKASLFRGHAIPVLARFSDFTGIPDIPDTAGEANPRGMALKFTLPDGATADVVAHSFNGFPAANAAEFRQLLLAIGASGPGAAKPTPVEQFLSTHPVAKTFLTTQKPPPQSYATLSYFGVNAFAFTNAQGKKVFVRYRFVPLGGETYETKASLAAKGPNYLVDELPQRLDKGPISFTWYAQIAEPGDVIDNPSLAWPDGRRLVKLGVIRLDRLAPDAAATDKASMFTPLNVPDGIAPADPMLGVRASAYSISFARR